MVKEKVAVTGASGHIGFHVASQLLQLNYHVVLLVRKENLNIIQLKGSGAQVIIVDLKDPKSYQDQLESIEVLFHLASENTTDIENEESILDNTFGLTKTVIDTALNKHVKTIIYTSSVVVLGRSKNPTILIDESFKADRLESPYVKGKILAERYCDQLIQDKEVDIRRIYPSWVVGSNNLKITPPHKTIKNYLQKGQWFYFDGGISVACVQTVAKAHIDAWLKGNPNEKYITAGNNVSFKSFYCTLAKSTGYIKPFFYVPKWLIYFASLAGKFLFGNRIPIQPEYVKAVIGNYSWYSSQKAIKELGYKIPKLDVILNAALIEIKKNK